MKNYNKGNIPLAKALRKNMTPQERKLWYEFLRSYPLRFQRQKAIGNYIADFYCAKAKLVVELDGIGHTMDVQIQADNQRTEELRRMGIRVIRFKNTDIDLRFKKVCDYIHSVIEFSAPSDEGAPAQAGEGGSFSQSHFAEKNV